MNRPKWWTQKDEEEMKSEDAAPIFRPSIENHIDPNSDESKALEIELEKMFDEMSDEDWGL